MTAIRDDSKSLSSNHRTAALSIRPLTCCQGRNHVFKVRGPIPWSRLQNKIRTVYPVSCTAVCSCVKSWGGPYIFFLGGGPDAPTPEWLRPCMLLPHTSTIGHDPWRSVSRQVHGMRRRTRCLETTKVAASKTTFLKFQAPHQHEVLP